MSNTSKKVAAIIGIVVGFIIIIIGFCIQNTSVYGIGESIKFGADFYTEMYSVTKDVGYAINYAINDLIRAIGWLIISLGAINICFFAYKLVTCFSVSENVESTQRQTSVINETVRIIAPPTTQEAEENIKPETEENTNCATEEHVNCANESQNQNTPDQNIIGNTHWICGKCHSKNLLSNDTCWNCHNHIMQ